ncbi:unnamed protein product, partial [Choristocarpus tenellus]
LIGGFSANWRQVRENLSSLLSDKLVAYSVCIEILGRPPESPTQTVVQCIVEAVERKGVNYLALLFDETRGSYRTVVTGCLQGARCGLMVIH